MYKPSLKSRELRFSASSLISVANIKLREFRIGDYNFALLSNTRHAFYVNSWVKLAIITTPPIDHPGEGDNDALVIINTAVMKLKKH